ncbi:hypothetical protein H0H93_013117 [Arthromyces matolae]|nr:hypothetical protein H0H93_013117 [Arthromyces matolae]
MLKVLRSLTLLDTSCKKLKEASATTNVCASSLKKRVYDASEEGRKAVGVNMASSQGSTSAMQLE